MTRGIIPGITGYVSKPFTYTVKYANGEQTFTEKFAVINIGKQYTNGASKTLDDIINAACTALGTAAGAATGGLGLALGPLASVALHWIKDQIFNPDGSITLMLAYHNIGCKTFGIDPTFWPGGLDPNFWEGIVNSILVALRSLGNKYNDVDGIDFSTTQQTNGNFSEEARPALS